METLRLENRPEKSYKFANDLSFIESIKSCGLAPLWVLIYFRLNMQVSTQIQFHEKFGKFPV